MSNLEEFQTKIGGQINAQELYDANVKTIKSTQYLTGITMNGLKIGIDDFSEFFKIEIRIITGLFFSINIPNELRLLVNPTSDSVLDYPIYLPQTHFNNDDKKLRLFINTIAIFLNPLKLQEDEGLLVYSDSISLILESKRDILGLLKGVVSIFLTNSSVFTIPHKKHKISSKGVPDTLLPLMPYIVDWSISDDRERSDAIDKMTPNQKKDLVNAVWPLITDINAYLNSFKNKVMPEVAMCIGNLTELVSELA